MGAQIQECPAGIPSEAARLEVAFSFSYPLCRYCAGQRAILARPVLLWQAPGFLGLAKSRKHLLVLFINGRSFRYADKLDEVSMGTMKDHKWIRAFRPTPMLAQHLRRLEGQSRSSCKLRIIVFRQLKRIADPPHYLHKNLSIGPFSNEKAVSGGLPSSMDPRIKFALRIMRRTNRADLTVAHVAEEVGLSASRFEHILKDATGRTFRQHKRSMRIRWAKRLLHDWNLSLKQIAYTQATGATGLVPPCTA